MVVISECFFFITRLQIHPLIVAGSVLPSVAPNVQAELRGLMIFRRAAVSFSLLLDFPIYYYFLYTSRRCPILRITTSSSNMT